MDCLLALPGYFSPITDYFKRRIVEAMKPVVSDVETDTTVPFTLMPDGTYMDFRSGYVYRQRGGGRRDTTLWYCKNFNSGCMARFTKNDDKMYFWDFNHTCHD